MKSKISYPKDFLLYILLYAWRMITLIFNSLPLTPLKDVYDKFPYLAFSNLKLNERRFKILILTLAFSYSIVALLGVLASLGMFKTAWIYASCLGYCDLDVKKPTHVYAIVLTNKERNFFDGGKRLLHGSPVRLDTGKHTFYSYAGAIVKLNGEDVMLGKGWRKVYEDRVFYDFDSFVGFYDHKMHSGASFSILTILFLSLGLFYSWIFFLFVPLFTAALILTKAKAYILVTFLISLGMIYKKLKILRLYPYAILSSLLAVYAILLYTPLKDAFLWSLKARLNFWEIGLKEPVKLFGVGYDNASSVLKTYYLKGLIDNTAHFHNSYLNSLVETGPFGMLMVVLITLYFIWKFLKASLMSEGWARAYFFGVGMSVLLVGLVGTVETNFDTATVNLLLTFLMGIGCALAHR